MKKLGNTILYTDYYYNDNENDNTCEDTFQKRSTGT